MSSINKLEFRFPTQAELNSNEIIYCLFERDKVLVKRITDDAVVPFLSEGEAKLFTRNLPTLTVGILTTKKILMAGSISDRSFSISGFELMPLIGLFFSQAEEQSQLVGRAAQLFSWSDSNQYCGRCGLQMDALSDEYRRQCKPCNISIYPRISPCIITLVTRGDKFLLAKNAQTKGQWYSTLAGFVEPGERLEDTLRREVFEEVGIKVGRVQYFGSQPWPFPGQLMVGFYAEYESGEIQVDGVEIIEADWFTKETLPSFPGEFSIAGQLINNFVKKL